MPKKNSSPIEASGVVLISASARGERILLLHGRKSRDWGFPKGHLDEGEDVFAAARRELLEETGVGGVSVEPGFRFSVRYRVRTRKGTLKPKKVTYFLARVNDPEVTLSDEHDEFRWATLEEADELLAHDNLRSLAREAVGYLRGRRP